MTRLEGPVECINGDLILRIPLDEGGQDLVACSRGIGQIDGEFLNILIRPWLAEKMGIVEGSVVVVDNENGKFGLWLSGQHPTTRSGD